MANPIRYSDIFDFTSDKGIQTAIKKIKSLDKVYTDFLANSKKLKSQYAADIQQVVKATEQLTKAVNGLNPAIKKDQQQLSAASKSMDILTASSQGLTQKTATLGTTIKKLESEQKKFNKSASETVRIEKEEARLKARLNSLDTARAQRIANLKTQIAQKNKELKKSAQESLKLVSIYDRESKRLAELAKRYKDYVVSGREGSRAARQLKKEHDALRASIVRADQATGVFNRNVGNYPKRFALAAAGVRQLASALGFTGVLFALVGAFRNAFNAIKNFQKENAILAGVLDKTRGEISELTKDAQRLGGITSKTATEVTGLQIAYARLGFTQDEIINLTEDTINGSIALNAALDETAELTGAVVRTFDDLGTMDADVILDQMTAATQRSALNFEKLQTSLPIVAGAANAAGISFTRLLALLGKLSDAGIDASMSATALRNIFIESASQGLSYEDILIKIGNSSDKLTASTDEFGKRAAVSGTILSNLTKEVGKLDIALQNSGGTAERVANEQLNTLSGKISLMQSAYERFIFSIENGDGVLSDAISGLLDFITRTINAFKELNEATLSWVDIANIAINPINAIRTAFLKLEESEKRASVEAKKSFDLQTEAIEIYEIAIKDGIKSAEDFMAIQDEFVHHSRDSEERLEILKRVIDLYDKSVQDASKSTKKFAEEEKELSINLNKSIKTAADFKREIEEWDDVLMGAQEGLDNLNKRFDPSDIEKFIESSEGATEIIKEQDQALKDSGDQADTWRDKLVKAAEKVALAIDAAFRVASTAVNQFFTNQSIKADNAFIEFEERQQAEIDALDARRERDLENENLTADAKKAINQRYADSISSIEDQIDQKRKQVQRDQAKSEKAQSLFNAILNTAQAITQTIATLGLPAAIPFVAAAGVIGAAQIAAIASQPLPAFAKGTDNAPGGLAVVGDGGKRELVMEPSGRTYLTSDKPEIRNIPKGSKVFPDADLVDREFGSTIMRNIIAGQTFDREIDNHNASVNKLQAQERLNNDQFRKTLTATLEKENDYMVSKFISGLQSLPLNNWSFTDKGQVTRSVQKGNTIRKNVELENKY